MIDAAESTSDESDDNRKKSGSKEGKGGDYSRSWVIGGGQTLVLVRLLMTHTKSRRAPEPVTVALESEMKRSVGPRLGTPDIP
jgi:hypothetical protein